MFHVFSSPYASDPAGDAGLKPPALKPPVNVT